ncbi:hypothetical protein MVEN_00076600 [Mycena venus]|uniref:Uncharacterized protein n=1 Tax=Mycena venus TaxID=2733690 RepID=A0A8H7DF83_9AGAR|nr:hypothetical protein MVEN_00076600 [Mycena venus]
MDFKVPTLENRLTSLNLCAKLKFGDIFKSCEAIRCFQTSQQNCPARTRTFTRPVGISLFIHLTSKLLIFLAHQGLGRIISCICPFCQLAFDSLTALAPKTQSALGLAYFYLFDLFVLIHCALVLILILFVQLKPLETPFQVELLVAPDISSPTNDVATVRTVSGGTAIMVCILVQEAGHFVHVERPTGARGEGWVALDRKQAVLFTI